MNCRVVVLNYNGKQLLEECLPSVAEAARKSARPCAVTVLDNQSADDSEAYVRGAFPGVEFVKASSNRVFCSYNEYVAGLKEEWVVLLNNDMKVDENFLNPLLSAFDSRKDVFFSAPRTLNFRSAEYEGCLSKLHMRFGLPWGSSRFAGYERKIDRAGITMQCGFGAFRRSLFLELGGFDDLYLPGTVEDSDLCFRAYRRGWRGYYCPESVVYHMGQASFKKAFGDSGLRRLNRRNLYLFVWKNIRDPLLLAEHVFFMPFWALKYFLWGQWDFLKGFGDALKLLPRALAKRRQARAEPSRLPDRAIFAYSRGI